MSKLKVAREDASSLVYSVIPFPKLSRISVHCALARREWGRRANHCITRAVSFIGLFPTSCCRGGTLLMEMVEVERGERKSVCA